MQKKITKYGPDDYRIEETKTIKVVSTANIKVLEAEIKKMDEDQVVRDAYYHNRKALLKELKAVKK